MVLKRNRDGNYMVGCLGFPQCRNVVWLPGSIAEAAVTSNRCNSCTPGPVYLIQFKFRQLEIPPNYNPNHLGCIGGCDDILRQLTEICGTGSRISARGRGTSSSSVQRGNTAQSVCVFCQQLDHSSNDCPSQVVGSRSARHRQTGESSFSCSNCGTPCVLRTANTTNNRGRKFYKCQSQECNFFAWEDSVDSVNGGNSAAQSNIRSSASAASNTNPGRNTGRGRGWGQGQGQGQIAATFVSATGEPISDRRCFVCGDPSHFANVCPNRGA